MSRDSSFEKHPQSLFMSPFKAFIHPHELWKTWREGGTRDVGLLKSQEMFLLLGRVRQEAKKNDFLAENEVTGKEFTQMDARTPKPLGLL